MKNKVAPIKLRYSQQPEPESWREYLPSVAGFVLAVLFSMAFALPMTYLLLWLVLGH
jgi:hypothetical protein